MIELPAIVAIPLSGVLLASLLVDHAGPFGIFSMLRYLAWASWARCRDQRNGNEITNPFCCTQCMMIWTTAGSAIVFYYSPAIVSVVAMIAMAWIINKLMGRL